MVATFWLLSVLVSQVERAKEQRLPARNQLRQYCLYFRGPVNVEDPAVDAVLSDQISMRSRGTEVHGEKKQPVGQAECSVDFVRNLAAEV